MAVNVTIPDQIPGLEDLRLIIDPNELSTVLATYVAAGSQKNALSITDLSIVMPSGTDLGDDASVKELFDAGSDFFSALIYQGISGELRSKIPVTAPDLSSSGRNLTSEMLATLIFVDYFYIYTQARHPTKEMDGLGTAERRYSPAQFILNTIGSTTSFQDIEALLFAKGLAKIPMSWIKKVPMSQISTEAQNRFLLGAAGHRLIQAFAVIRYKDDTPDDVKAIWAKLIAYTQAGYSWNFHTAFRTVGFVRKFKSLNKILENLLATYGRDEDLAQAVTIESKTLYKKPQADSRYRDYSSLLDPFFQQQAETDKIFTA